MIGSEKAITKKIMGRLNELGFWTLKIHGGAYQMAGLPDILAIKEGKAYWIEVKRPGGKPTALQLKRLRDLKEAGCGTGIATTIEEAENIIDRGGCSDTWESNS